jgi:hypothetical protein
MVEPHPVLRQPVEIWRFVGLSAIRAYALVAKVIGKNQQDVRPIFLTACGQYPVP